MVHGEGTRTSGGSRSSFVDIRDRRGRKVIRDLPTVAKPELWPCDIANWFPKDGSCRTAKCRYPGSCGYR